MSRLAHNLDSILQRVDDTALVKGRTLKEVVRSLKKGIPIAGKNMRGQEMPDGILLSATGGGGAACPWDAVVGGAFQFSNPGTLNGVLPSNMFSAGVLFSTAMPATGFKWVYLAASASDNEITAVSLATSTGTPEPPGVGEGTAPASFKLPLWLLAPGAGYKLVGCGALFARPYVVITSDRSPAVCGGDPLVRHWSWRWDAS